MNGSYKRMFTPGNYKRLFTHGIYKRVCPESMGIDEIRRERIKAFRMELTEYVKDRRKAQANVADQDKPGTPSELPFDIRLILKIFTSPTNCDAFAGDLQERYSTILEVKGRITAAIWFWRQVFTSIWPLIWAAVRHRWWEGSSMATAIWGKQ